MFAAAAATAGVQAALGLPGTLVAIIAMVVFGDPTASTSIATALLARPWNVIGQGLPPAPGSAPHAASSTSAAPTSPAR